MSLQPCNKVCVNIAQNFSNPQKEQAQKNLGLYPLGESALWYNNTVTFNSSSYQHEIELGYLPESMLNVIDDMKRYLIFLCIHIDGTTGMSTFESGTVALMFIELIDDGQSILGSVSSFFSDIGGHVIPCCHSLLCGGILGATGITPVTAGATSRIFRLDVVHPSNLFSGNTNLDITVKVNYVLVS